MWNDPIVEETRRIRDEIAARFNYDVRSTRQVLSGATNEGESSCCRAAGQETTD